MHSQREIIDLANLIGNIRPEWQQPGIIAGLRAVPGDYAGVATLAIANANDPTIRTPAALGQPRPTGHTTDPDDTSHSQRIRRAKQAAHRKATNPDRYRTTLAPEGWYDTHPLQPDPWQPGPVEPVDDHETRDCDTCGRPPRQCVAVRTRLGNDHRYTPSTSDPPDTLKPPDPAGVALARHNVPAINRQAELPYVPADLAAEAAAPLPPEPDNQDQT